MKLKLILRGSVTCFALGVSGANAGYFIGGALQNANDEPVFDEDDVEEWNYSSKTIPRVFGGYVLNDNWIIEAGYNGWGLEKNHEGIEDRDPESTEEFKNSISLGMRSKIPLSAGFDAEIGMGLHRWTLTAEENVTLQQKSGNGFILVDKFVSADVSGVDVYYSFGARYRILPQIEAGIDYFKYHAHLDNIDGYQLSLAYYFGKGLNTGGLFDVRDVYLKGMFGSANASIDSEWTDSVYVDEYIEDEYDVDVDDEDISIDFSEDLSDTSFSLLVGYQISPAWALEVGFIDLGSSSVTLDSIHLEQSIPKVGSDLSIGAKVFERDVDGFTYGVSYNIMPFSKVSPYVRAGIWDWDFSYSRIDSPDDETSRSNLDGVSYYLGLGVVYAITPQLSVFAEVDRYDYSLRLADVQEAIDSESGENNDDDGDDDSPNDYTDLIAIGIQYRFGAVDKPSKKRSAASGLTTYPNSAPVIAPSSSGGYNPSESQTPNSYNETESEPVDEEETTEEASGDDADSDTVACDPRYKHMFFGCD